MLVTTQYTAEKELKSYLTCCRFQKLGYNVSQCTHEVNLSDSLDYQAMTQQKVSEEAVDKA